MQSVISKGKDIHEAILLGLELLGVSKKEVHIEIIDHGAKRFFGIRSKDATVRLTKLAKTSPLEQLKHKVETKRNEINEEEFVTNIVQQLVDANRKDVEVEDKNIETEKSESLEGKAWVSQGNLHIQSSSKKFPLLTACTGITVYKNNKPIKHRNVVLSTDDRFELKVNDEERETKWKIYMDKHKLHVYLEIEPGYKLKRTIVDVEPDYHIQLKVEELKETYNTLNYNEVIEKLASLRVVHGFNHAEIMKALQATEPGTYEVATGIKPLPGNDGYLEVMVDLTPQTELKEAENGCVDYRESSVIPTVEKGQVIGVVHPPTPGQCGYTVTNEPLLVKQTLPVIVNKGKGVMEVADKIVATESGRPLIEKRGRLVKVSIMPKITLAEVDLTSGNVHFKGDVEVLGSVDADMLVETTGNIIIHQEVYMATMIASGAIITSGNIIGSEISAGKSNMVIVELGQLLGELQHEIDSIISVVKQLMRSSAYTTDYSTRGLQPIIRLLIEKKFKTLPSLIKKYNDAVRRGKHYLEDNEWEDIACSLLQLLVPTTGDPVSLQQLIRLSLLIKDLYEMSQLTVEPDSYIRVPNVLNSRLFCSGDIEITGEGCVNSKIHAGGHLKIRGTIRGGVVYGQLGVEINEVGAEIGTPTFIETTHGQTIRLNKAMEGTTIKIGNIKHTFSETRFLVKAYIGHNNKLRIE